MTNIQDGKIKDILPYSNLRIKALSYALNIQIRKLKLWSDTSRVKAMIDDLQEDAVDMLAKIQNTPFYDTTFTIDKKRILVKNTQIYYQYLGTKYGIHILLTDAFGGGDIYKEWYEYDGEPYHFYIYIQSQMYTEEAKQEFLRKLKQFSRLSVFCDGIVPLTVLPNSIVKASAYLKLYRKVEVSNYVQPTNNN